MSKIFLIAAVLLAGCDADVQFGCDHSPYNKVVGVDQKHPCVIQCKWAVAAVRDHLRAYALRDCLVEMCGVTNARIECR